MSLVNKMSVSTGKAINERHEYIADNDGSCHQCTEGEGHLVHVPTGKTIVAVDWSDGRYFFQRVMTHGHATHVVPEKTVRKWEAIAALDDQVNDQLRDLDNARHARWAVRLVTCGN